MKKIGIITHYYKSINYGGNLQAYALCAALKKISVDAEQICYPTSAPRKTARQILAEEGPVVFAYRVCRKLLKTGLRFIRKATKTEKESPLARATAARKQSFNHFNSAVIPNSATIYNDDTLQKLNAQYDGFITGSDQVWNLNFFRPGYFLGFADKGRKKISYAASVAMKEYSSDQKEYVKKQLEGFSAISVREDSAKDIIQELTDLDVQVVVDPVLLLSADEWSAMCSDNISENNYIFTYFLGHNMQARSVCNEFARRNGLKIITIQMAKKDGRLIDENFGDIIKNDASPEDFLALIKNAAYVFTDSFHATVFSYLFRKQFFVFDRNTEKSMNSRIIDITELFGTEDRYCSDIDHNTAEYVSTLQDIDYSGENTQLQKRIEESYRFLRENLGGNDW